MGTICSSCLYFRCMSTGQGIKTARVPQRMPYMYSRNAHESKVAHHPTIPTKMALNRKLSRACPPMPWGKSQCAVLFIGPYCWEWFQLVSRAAARLEQQGFPSTHRKSRPDSTRRLLLYTKISFFQWHQSWVSKGAMHWVLPPYSIESAHSSLFHVRKCPEDPNGSSHQEVE